MNRRINRNNKMKCSICGKEMQTIYEQNNPWPLYPIGTTKEDLETKGFRCCSDCNVMFVIPSRLSMKYPSMKLPKEFFERYQQTIIAE